MNMLDLLAQAYPGWSLTELRSLSNRERINWLNATVKRIRR
jgi:hypothetical protein